MVDLIDKVDIERAKVENFHLIILLNRSTAIDYRSIVTS
jgi:hypothetical protein